MDIIKTEGVSKSFTGHRALDNVDLRIPEGSIYGLLGPNGAGKTTLIRIINHITAPDAGRVWFGDHQLVASDVVNIGYLPEERGLYKKMKVGEQAVFFARLKGLSRKDAERELRKWFERFGISEWWNKKVEELSKGMAQKIQFIVTVLHRPKLLIFDEPFSGFDPINARLLKDEILRLRDEGATVIFSTHNMESVEDLCDEFTLINRSKVILSGNVEEIRRRMGKDFYSVAFRGEPDKLLARLGDDVVDSFADATSSDAGEIIHRYRFRLRPGTPMREFISAVNEAVEIDSFSSTLPSMNDIFIRTVETSEAGRQQLSGI